MTHPSSPPAPMTAERLYEVREQYRSGRWGDGLPRELFGHIDALAARVAELERDNADVLKLGDEFGFEDRPFSVSQVLTHARYLQSERARLLFESVTLKAELAAARKDAWRGALEEAASLAAEYGRAISKGLRRSAGPNDTGEQIAEAIRALQTKDTTK